MTHHDHLRGVGTGLLRFAQTARANGIRHLVADVEHHHLMSKCCTTPGYRRASITLATASRILTSI